MNDPVLGVLKSAPQFSTCMLASVSYQGREISLTLDPDGEEVEACLGLARDLVTSLEVLESKARAVAAEKLLDEYNQSWRTFSRARADGSMEEVIHPVLAGSEFRQRLGLESLAVTGSMIEFCFTDDGLFAGHSIFVTSFDGTGFTDTDATLFG